MIFLFDFDGTLMPFRGKFPRQTRHALRRLEANGHVMGIVTNNIIAFSMLNELGIQTYVGDTTIAQCNSSESRVELITRWFVLVMSTEPTSFYYFDDRVDQVAAVRDAFPDTCLGSFHVSDPRQLYRSLPSHASVHDA